MKTVDLNKVLEMLINEEHTEATGLLHEWFVETSKKVHEDIMAEDNSLSQDIEDDQEAIESEEFYSEAEGDDEVAADAEEVAADDAEGDMDLEPGAEIEGPAEVDAEVSLGDTIEDLEAVMARLKAEFAEITGEPVAGEADLEEAVPAYDPDSGMSPEDYENAVADGVFDDEEDYAARDLDDKIEKYLGHCGPETRARIAGYLDGIRGEADYEDQAAAYMNAEADGEFGDVDEEVTESEDDFADLEESWTLEPVKDPNLQGGKEIGAHGAKVHLNDKSPLPEHDAEGRVGGAAVEIKAEEHHGYDREPAPEVKGKPLLKNQVKKSTDGRTKVSKEGDKSAMLNSKAGFGSDSPKSPIGQATDLRGNDLKRK